MTRRLLAPLLAAALAACGVPEPVSLTVFAAASLADAFEDLAVAYEAETGVELVLSSDASSTLRTQIEEGADPDLFASADVVNAEALVEAGLTDGDAVPFVSNALAIVVPADNPAGVTAWSDLADEGLRIVAAGEDVPITGYATELIAYLAGLPDAPDGFAAAYESNVVSREDNVRSVLAKIELGEGDASIVYETDAASSEEVAVIELPEDANVVAQYAFVTLADAEPGTDVLAAWLIGEEAQTILAEHGFRPPEG